MRQSHFAGAFAIETGEEVDLARLDKAISLSVGGQVCTDFHRYLNDDMIVEHPRFPVHALLDRSHAMPPADKGVVLAGRLDSNAVSTGIAIGIDGRPVPVRLADSFAAAVAVIDDPQIQAAVVVLDADALTQRGLPCDHFATLSFWRSDEAELWNDTETAALRAMTEPHCRDISMPGAANPA